MTMVVMKTREMTLMVLVAVGVTTVRGTLVAEVVENANPSPLSVLRGKDAGVVWEKEDFDLEQLEGET